MPEFVFQLKLAGTDCVTKFGVRLLNRGSSGKLGGELRLTVEETSANICGSGIFCIIWEELLHTQSCLIEIFHAERLKNICLNILILTHVLGRKHLM